MNDMTDRSKPSANREWRLPALLLALSAIPILAGAVRVIGLAGAAEVTPENARFFAAPLPMVLHIVGASGWCVLGAFQISTGIRRRNAGWHRGAGRLLVLLGLVTALSGLWMTFFYPPVQYDGRVVYFMRLAVGSSMAVFICLGFYAIHRRDIAAHQAWMVRAYALALGAGTQVLTHVPYFLFEELQGELGRTVCMASGWVINLAVAEWFIRERPALPTHAPA